MFNLSRYFLTLSFVLVVLAAGVLGPLYHNLRVGRDSCEILEKLC